MRFISLLNAYKNSLQNIWKDSSQYPIYMLYSSAYMYYCAGNLSTWSIVY